jgi:hypothetical protein
MHRYPSLPDSLNSSLGDASPLKRYPTLSDRKQIIPTRRAIWINYRCSIPRESKLILILKAEVGIGEGVLLNLLRGLYANSWERKMPPVG